MIKNLLLIICFCFINAAVAGISPFSQVRSVGKDDKGNPIEEIIDLTICLERIPSDGNLSDVNSKATYENIIMKWADGIYEMTNGANFLGHIRIFTGGDFLTGCDVIWKKEGVWPNANAGAFNHGGSLQISDYFSLSPDVDRRLGDNKIDFAMALTHESMHYIYGLSDQYYENKVERNECIDISADVQNNLINVLFKCDKTDAKYSGNYAHLKKVLTSYVKNVSVMFNPESGTIPDDLMSNPSNRGLAYWEKQNYHQISAVIDNLEKGNLYSFSLKDVNGNPVDIKSSGTGDWNFSLPPGAAASAHTVSWDQWKIKDSYLCPNIDVQWQWINFSTRFNQNKNS